jgi:hypothetical protein
LGASQVIPVPLFIVARTGVIHPILDHVRDERVGDTRIWSRRRLALATPPQLLKFSRDFIFFHKYSKAALRIQEIIN